VTADLSLRSQRSAAHILSPIDSAEIDTGVCGKLKVDLACNGEQRRGRYGERTQERSVLLASLSLGLVPTGLYSAFSNPVLGRLGFGMVNMRLISRERADRGRLFRCWSDGSAGVLFRRQVR
jgi:hypothetical protein